MSDADVIVRSIDRQSVRTNDIPHKWGGGVFSSSDNVVDRIPYGMSRVRYFLQVRVKILFCPVAKTKINATF